MKGQDTRKSFSDIDLGFDAETAADENEIRRELANLMNYVREKRGLSIRELAKKMRTSKSQMQRLMHKELGGNLTLRTLVRASKALGITFSIMFEDDAHEIEKRKCNPSS